MQSSIIRCLLGVALVTLLACGAQYPASSATPMTNAELKYRLIDQFGPVQFCGPPVGKSSEAAKADAVAAFPDIQKDSDAFKAIVRHTQLANITDFTADQKLVVYNEYERLKAITFDPVGDRQHFALSFADQSDPKRTTFIEGTVDRYGVIQVSKREARGALNCPICLAAGTLIDTPAGPVRVEDVRPGALVWTADIDGRRLVARVDRTVRTPVPRDHEVVHVRLRDGRELYASPGHPSGSGQLLSALAVGDMLDGSRVLLAQRVRYAGEATFDILPAGPTGTYWANGVLLQSTLKN
jgi:Hint domain-containing protein